MIDVLFHQQADWAFGKEPLRSLRSLAKQMGFTQEGFDACLTNQSVLDGIRWVGNRGVQKFGVNSTPTFFINGQIQRGEKSIDELATLIASYLTH